jgi:hypothetical protein
MEKRLILLFACHFIGDFPFQSDFLAMNKGKSWEINLYHSLVHATPFVIWGNVSPAFIYFIVPLHFIVDALKARYQVIKSIWLDQLLHIFIIILAVLLGL